MASLRSPAIRHLISRPPLSTQSAQRRWAQVQDVRFVLKHSTATERVLDKYRHKLDRKAKEEGHDGIDGLKEAYKDRIAELRKKASVPGATGPLPPSTQAQQQSTASSHASSQTQQTAPSASSPYPPPPPPPQPQAIPKPPPGIKPLSSYIDIQKTLALPPKEIEYIWRLRHASSPNSLCAVIPLETYDLMAATARQHPQFILPLPRDAAPPSAPEKQAAQDEPSPAAAAAAAEAAEAAEIHFLQWSFPHPTTPTILFTHLADYKLRGEYAQPHTTITLHTELARAKGLVLVRGEVLRGRGVGVDEARWLVMCLQKFYGVQGGREERRRLLSAFTRGDEGFCLEELVREARRVG